MYIRIYVEYVYIINDHLPVTEWGTQTITHLPQEEILQLYGHKLLFPKVCS